MNPFETETMADLCLRQGHRDQALAIYRRLVARASDEAARARMSRRIAAIEAGHTDGDAGGGAGAGGGGGSGDASDAAARANDQADDDAPALTIPGVRARVSGDQLAIEWQLPPDTSAPALEVLLVTRGPAGVETETRSWVLEAPSGRLVVAVPGLHSARAAAGTRARGDFVPLARSR